jgi:hypothetical protein
MMQATTVDERCDGSASVLTLTTERAQRSARDREDDPFRPPGPFSKGHDPIPFVAIARTRWGFGIVRTSRP